MNKEKLLKIIPYVILIVGVILTLSSFVAMESIENRCNEHWEQQFKDYQREINPISIEPYLPGINWNSSLPTALTTNPHLDYKLYKGDKTE